MWPQMNTSKPLRTIASTIVVALALGSASLADNLDLNWWTVAGGGASFGAGGDYELGGTVGQPDAGIASGGTLLLKGGFWSGVQIPCPADLNDDGIVDLPDLAILLSHYGQSGIPASYGDLNGDDAVDLSDLAQLLGEYGDVCP